MKRRLAAVLAAATAVLAVGCSSGAATPSSSSPASSASGAGATIPLLRFGTTYPVSSLDPAASFFPGFEVNPLILETLLQMGPQGQLEPDLATSVTTPNPVTYVYHLRHGVRFWDGTELTSADVVYSLNLDHGPGSVGSAYFGSFKSIRADGPYTVVVTLTHPDASWRYTPALEFSDIFEMKFAEEHKSTFGKPGTLVMGSGPWKVDSLDPTKGVVLSANPHWWGGKVPIQRITFTFYSNETSEALAFRAGEIDADPYILDERSFATTSGTKLINTLSDNTGVFSMNTQSPGWNDVHVRRAVAYAIDRTDIIAANGGYATPIYTFIPANMLETIASPTRVSSLLASLPQYKYNLAKARQEMAQSAYPHGFSTTLLEYSGDGQAVDQGQAIAAELARIGIHAQIKAMSLSAWQAIESGPASKRVTDFAATGGPSTPDPSGFDFMLGSQNTQVGGFNTADYAPAAVNKLLAASLATTNSGQRFTIYSQLLRQLGTDVPYVPLYADDTSMALAPAFTDAGFSQWFVNTPYALTIKRAA
jgi:peptide/nickel transport system substrate-binding protein